MASILEIDPEQAGFGAAAETFGQFSGPQRLPQNLGSILGRAGGAYTRAKNNAIEQDAKVGLLRDSAAQREMAILLQVQQQQKQQKFQSILGQQRASGEPMDEISILNAGIQSGAFGPKEITDFMGKVSEKQAARTQRLDELRLRLEDQKAAREDRERNQRELMALQQQHREDMVRLSASLKAPPREPLRPVKREDGKIVYSRDVEGMEVPPSTSNRPLPPNAVKDLGEKGESVTTFKRLLGNFQDDFGGKGSQVVGDAQNLVGRNIGLGKSEQANWWQDYQNQKNIIRNKLFGSALTATEAAEFDKANINPGMTPKIIRENLDRQRQAAVRAAKKLSGAYRAGGYSDDMINEAMGLAQEDLADTTTTASAPKPWEKRR